MQCSICLICIVISFPYIFCDFDSNLGEVVFVNVLYRHGNRTPVDPYPTDPYRNLSYWPTGWGQLTKDGMMGHYQLGKWLRERYSSLLPAEYDRNDIFVQSTDVDRTLMSAYSDLAGLYEPNPAKNWDSDIKWRPIPVHTIPEPADMVKPHHMVLAGKKKCPKYNKLLKDLLNSPKFTLMLEESAELREKMSNATESPIDSLEDVEYVYNTLFIESLFKFPLPSWTHKLFPEPMKSIADFSFAVPCFTKPLTRLKIGPLVREMVTNMEKKAEGKLNPDRKMWMYSAHDTTVADLLQAIGDFNFLSPPYFSTVLIELRKFNNDHYVNILYRNSSLDAPYQLKIPGCSEPCSLKQTRLLLQDVIPHDWETECQLTVLEQVYDATSLAIIIYVFSSAVLLMVLALSFQFFFKRHPIEKDIAYQSLSLEAT